MTDRRDIHAAEPGPFSHRSDRRCACGPRVLIDMNVPSRLVFVHRQPPIPPKETP